MAASQSRNRERVRELKIYETELHCLQPRHLPSPTKRLMPIQLAPSGAPRPRCEVVQSSRIRRERVQAYRPHLAGFCRIASRWIFPNQHFGLWTSRVRLARCCWRLRKITSRRRCVSFDPPLVGVAGTRKRSLRVLAANLLCGYPRHLAARIPNRRP